MKVIGHTCSFFFILSSVLNIHADVLSLTGLPQGAVCPDQVTVLTCSIENAALQWAIPDFGVVIDFNAVNPDGATKSAGGFVAMLTAKSPPSTNSTLSFVGNSTLNGTVIRCLDASVNPLSEINITLNYASPPSSPIAVNTTVLNCSSVSISWAPPTNTGGVGISTTSYTITLSPSPNTPHNTDCTEGGVCNTTSTSIILAGLQYGTDYTICINASNCAGTGNGYTTVKKMTFESSDMFWSTDISVLSCDTAKLSWEPPLSQQQQVLLSYNITQSDSSTGYSQQYTTANTQFDISLTCDTNYIVQAIVCDQILIEYTNTTEVTSPAPPRTLTVPLKNCSHVQLQWIPPTPASDYPIIYWVSYWSSSGSINQAITTTTLGTSLTVETPDIVTSSYTFTVSASVCNCSQHQSESISISVSALDPEPPGSVQSLAVENCRLVSWDPPLTNNTSIQAYSVSIDPPSDDEDCQCLSGCNVSSISINIPNCLSEDNNYTISVVPIDTCNLIGDVSSVNVTCISMDSDGIFPTYIWIIVGVCGGLLLGALIILIVSYCHYCIKKRKVKKSRSKNTAIDKEERVYIEIKEQPPEIPRAQVSPYAPPSPREPLPDRVPILTAEETQPDEPPSPLPPPLPRPYQPDSVVETNEKVQYAELSSVRPATVIKPPLMESEVNYSSISHTPL